jgi:O-antigen/teichoic acid export membrane protein
MSLRKIALGTAAMSSVSVLRLLVQFLVVPILSRLLSPEDYGVVAMAMPFILFTMIFTDAGIGQSLVRTDMNKTEAWSTSFWLTIMLGAGLGLFIAALAPVAAWFFEEPRLQPIIFALSGLVIFQAGATIPEAVLRQRHKFGTIAAAEMTAVAAGLGTAVLIGIKGGGAWALVGQQLALYVLRFIMTFSLAKFRPRFVFTLKEVKEHLLFGRDIIGASFVNYIAQSADSFLIGKMLGASILGIYTMAFTFVRLPLRIIAGPLQYVVYAYLSPLHKDTELMKKTFIFLTRILSLALYPSIGLVAAAAHPVFTVFLSETWRESGTLFMIAAPAAAVQAVTGLRITYLLALGKTTVQLRTTTEACLMAVAALAISVSFGVTWVVVAFNVAIFLYLPRALMLLLPLINCTMGEYLRTMFWPVATTLAGCALYYELAQNMGFTEVQKIILGAVISVSAIILSGLLEFKTLKREAAALRDMLPKKS